VPLAPAPGQPARYDYAYRRTGTCHLFLCCAPPAGWRHLAVTAQRTMQDFAEQRRWRGDGRYAGAAVMRGVWENLTPFWGRFFESGHAIHVFPLTQVPVTPAA